MAHSLSEAFPRRDPLRKAARAVILAAIGGFVTYTAVKGIAAAFFNDDFPEGLAVKVELLPLIFPVHMVTGGLALILLPLALLLRRSRPLHRLVGRAGAATVLVSGLTAFPVAWVVPVTPWSAAGFSAQAATWLVLLALGLRNIRRGRVAAHRTCMLLMVATTSGAVFFRIYLALWAMYGANRTFELFYSCDAWLAWTLPLAATAAVLKLRRASPPRAASGPTGVPARTPAPRAAAGAPRPAAR